jgi:hypothetical protein
MSRDKIPSDTASATELERLYLWQQSKKLIKGSDTPQNDALYVALGREVNNSSKPFKPHSIVQPSLPYSFSVIFFLKSLERISTAHF